MTVYIVKDDGSSQYRWRVQVGTGRGGRVKSRHRKKSRALSKGRSLARRRGDVLKQQMQAGFWRTVASY